MHQNKILFSVAACNERAKSTRTWRSCRTATAAVHDFVVLRLETAAFPRVFYYSVQCTILYGQTNELICALYTSEKLGEQNKVR